MGSDKRLRLVAAAVLATMPSVAFGWMQAADTHASGSPSDARTFAYEVVSIRPAKDTGGMSWRTTNDGFVTEGVTIRNLVMDAFELITDEQLSGMPAWSDKDIYDIQAKMDADTAAAFKKLSREERERQSDLMMQAVLAERFNLKFHRQTKDIPVYVLVVAKGGSKLKETPAKTSMGYSTGGGKGAQFLKGQGIEIDNLAHSMSGAVGRLIVNKTGLTGRYDMDLKWSSADAPESTDAPPSIFAALEEQLGLKLESTKAPVETIVVEHIDKPSEN